MAVWKIKERNELVRANQHESLGTQGLNGGGNNAPALSNVIEKIDISSNSNGSDFGDLSVTRDNLIKGGGQLSRGIFAGGTTPSNSDVIDQITFGSGGDATDFGDLSIAGYTGGKASNNTRDVFNYTAGGRVTNISYYSFIGASSGGKDSDFGDSTTTTEGGIQGISDGSRAIFGGGSTNPTTQVNTLEFVTMNSLGNATDFGDLNNTMRNGAAVSSRTRGIVGGGLFFNSPSPGSSNQTYNVLDFVTIASAGNATDFGDLTVSRQCTAVDNTTRGVFLGGYIYPSAPSNTAVNTMDTIEIATTGNATDFGDLAANTRQSGGLSNGHGGLRDDSLNIQRYSVTNMPGTGRVLLVSPGYDPSPSNNVQDTIELIHIPTQGNSSDFGNLTVARKFANGGGSSLTRGFVAGGQTPSNTDTIDGIEFATQGNAFDFGNLSAARFSGGALSSSTRGVLGGGSTGSAVNIIEYITVAAAGNATDFGDLSVARAGSAGGASSTRGIFMGGGNPRVNTTDYITIASTGNATDFGDLTRGSNSSAGISNIKRGVFGGGNPGSSPNETNIIDYVNITTLGDANDFGDLTVARIGISGVSVISLVISVPACHVPP